MADDAVRRWYHDLSVVRWIFAIFGILIMLFTGGCSLMVFADFLQRGTDTYGFNSPLVTLTVGGIPFVVGLLVWWLAAKAGRKPVQ